MDDDPEQYSDEEFDYNEFTDEEIKDLMRDVLNYELRERRKTPTQKKVDDALISILQEFLVCFKLIGYDYEGNLINATMFHENLEKAALDNAFADEMSRFVEEKMRQR